MRVATELGDPEPHLDNLKWHTAPTDLTNFASDRVLGTAKPLEHYLHEYEKTLPRISLQQAPQIFQLGNSMQQSAGQAVAGCACCASPQPTSDHDLGKARPLRRAFRGL